MKTYLYLNSSNAYEDGECLVDGRSKLPLASGSNIDLFYTYVDVVLILAVSIWSEWGDADLFKMKKTKLVKCDTRHKILTSRNFMFENKSINNSYKLDLAVISFWNSQKQRDI